ncbi:MAG: DNA translocase FtsK 4TM domain-containing protein, partial [Rubrivivax sp.]
MSFPLGSLQGDPGDVAAPGAGAEGATGWRRKARLGLGALALLLFFLAMATRHAGDPAFSTSGTGEPVRNAVGLLGARAADLALFLFGWSAWWLLPVALRAWLGALARSMRGEPAPAPAARAQVLLGLALLLAASCALAWTRLYRFEPVLPGHAGGVFGWWLGPLSMQWLGFAGSGVLWIAALLAGSSLALRFSWLSVIESLGAWVDRLRERRAETRERAEDLRLGELAAREREHVVVEERQAAEDHPPVVVAPPAAPPAPSARVARERQQPLFAELSDNRLPQVDLLD